MYSCKDQSLLVPDFYEIKMSVIPVPEPAKKSAGYANMILPDG
jgi:hypothetical protein